MNWIKQFTGLISEFKTGSGKNLFQNILSLSFLQISNYLIPLIVLPYLIRVIGIEKYGLIAFAQAIMQYFIILTDYGFNLSATREIAANRNDKTRVSEIFWSVSIIKSILILISFGILAILILWTDKFGNYAALYLYSFGMVVGNLLFPVWFFQGIEKMKYTAALHLMGKIFYLVTLFIFVTEATDYLYAPLLYSSGMILAGLIALFIILFKFKIPIVMPSLSVIKTHFKDSTQFFLSQVSVSLYTTLNTVALGLFTTNEMVGLFAAAEKIFIAMRAAFAPVSQALYPYMTGKRNLMLMKKIYYLALSAAILIGAAVFLLSDQIVKVAFGPGMELSAEVLRIYAIVLPFSATSIMLGYPLLAAVGYKKNVNRLLITASLLHISLLVIIIPVIDPVKVAVINLMTVIAVVSMIVMQIKKHNLWHSLPEAGQ